MRKLAKRVLAQPPERVLALGPRAQDQQNGRALGQLEEAANQGEARGVRPVQVLEREDDRALAGASLGDAGSGDGLADATARLLAGRSSAGVARRRRPSMGPEQLPHLLRSGVGEPVAKRRPERPVGKRLAVGDAAALEPDPGARPPSPASKRARSSATRRDFPIPASPETIRTPPDPSQHRAIASAAAASSRSRPTSFEPTAIAPPAAPLAVRETTGYAVTDSALPLRVSARGSPHSKSSAIDFCVSAPTSTIPASGRGLQPSGRVERVADRPVLDLPPAADGPQHREPGLDPDPDGEPLDAPIARDRVASSPDRLDDAQAGQDRPLGIVLVGDRRAEQGQQAVARVLGHGSPPNSATASAIRVTAPPTIALKSSGSRRSPSAVEPTTSAKSAVTTCRASRAPARRRGAPQEEQNRASPVSGAPQLAQAGTTRRV